MLYTGSRIFPFLRMSLIAQKGKEDIPQPTLQALCKQLQVLKKTAREKAAGLAPGSSNAKVFKARGRRQSKTKTNPKEEEGIEED